MPATRSAHLRSPWQVEVRRIDLPDTPPDGEALLRVEACGICGSDLNAAAWGAADWTPFGHEIAAEVVAVGRGAGALRVGDRVALMTSGYCGACELCRDGRMDLCRKAPGFWGRPAMGLADFMLAPAACCVRYEGLEPEAAALAEPAGVALDMVKTAAIRHGDSLAIVGPGPLGLMAIPLAIRSGAARVVCVGRSAGPRLDLARRLGAETLVLDGPVEGRPDLAEAFDHVLLTAPPDLIPRWLSALAYGGELTYVGFGPRGEIRLDANDFHRRKLQLRASFASPALYFPAALKLIRSGAIPADAIITHRFALSEIEEAMALLRDDRGRTGKVVIVAED